MTYRRAALVADPAKPADEYPPYEKLPLPPLNDVRDSGLAKTPPMGWNSWNKFEGGINDAIVREMADAMVTSGMRNRASPRTVGAARDIRSTPRASGGCTWPA